MKILYSIFSIALFIGSTGIAQSNKADKFDPQRDAAQDIENAVTEVQESNKRILLDVGGEWCIWCHRLDDFFDRNEKISEFLDNNFIVVKLNYSKENKNEEVLSKYPEIPGYPHFFVLGSTGKFLHSQGTGELEKDKGYDPEKVMNFLKEWAPKE